MTLEEVSKLHTMGGGNIRCVRDMKWKCNTIQQVEQQLSAQRHQGYEEDEARAQGHTVCNISWPGEGSEGTCHIYHKVGHKAVHHTDREKQGVQGPVGRRKVIRHPAQDNME